MKPLVRVDASKRNEAEEIIQLVASGVMSPRSAEMALAQMEAEFEQQTMQGFTTESPEWPIVVAVLYLSWRNLTIVNVESERYQRWTSALWQDPFDPMLQILSLPDAEMTLKDQLVTGIVRSFGTNKAGMCRRIGDEQWEFLSFYKPLHANQDQWSAVSQEGALEYEEVFVIRDELLSIFPEIDHVSREHTVRGEAPLPEVSAAPGSAETKTVALGTLPIDMSKLKRGRGRPEGSGYEQHDMPIVAKALARFQSGDASSFAAAVKLVSSEFSEAELKRYRRLKRKIEGLGQ